MQSGIFFVYKTLLSKRDFRENRLSDSYSLLKDVNEFILLLSMFLHRYFKIRYTGFPPNALSRYALCGNRRSESHTFT